MNTSGTGSEGWFIMTALTLLVGVGMLLAGGPTEFLDQVDSTLIRTATQVVQWVRSWV
jgi:hypothetical protein